MRTLSRILMAALALATGSGCATATLLAKATGFEKECSSSSLRTWVPTGPVAHSLHFELAYVPPPPVPEPAPAAPELQSPPPVVVVLPPPPGPGPVILPLPPPPPPAPPEPAQIAVAPLPASARLVCRQDSQIVSAHYRTERWLYEPHHKLLIGFFGLGETALSAFSFGVAKLDSGGVDAGAIVAGVLMGLDALGTWALLAHPKTHWVVEEDGKGPAEEKPGCPEGLSVEVDGLRSEVAPEGSVPLEVGVRLLEAMRRPGASFSVAVGASARTVEPTAPQRCRFAELNRLPPPEGCPVWWVIPEQGWALELGTTPLPASASRATRVDD